MSIQYAPSVQPFRLKLFRSYLPGLRHICVGLHLLQFSVLPPVAQISSSCALLDVLASPAPSSCHLIAIFFEKLRSWTDVGIGKTMTISSTALELKEGWKSFNFENLARPHSKPSTLRFSIARKLLDFLFEHASFGRGRIKGKRTIQPDFAAPLNGAGSWWTRSVQLDHALSTIGEVEVTHAKLSEAVGMEGKAAADVQGQKRISDCGGSHFNSVANLDHGTTLMLFVRSQLGCSPENLSPE